MRDEYIDIYTCLQHIDYVLWQNHAESDNLVYHNDRNDDIYEVYHMYFVEPDNMHFQEIDHRSQSKPLGIRNSQRRGTSSYFWFNSDNQ